MEERTALRRERRLTLAGSAEFRVRGVRDAGRERDGDRPCVRPVRVMGEGEGVMVMR